MAYLIPDKQFINENILQFEKRMESQYTRFLNKNPTFVNYYSIDTVNSTTDSGIFDIEEVLGNNSPIRFKKIEDFPIYGIESILLDLEESEEGLTTNYESEAIILPNTIEPMPNEFFTISYLNKNYLFMVNQVSYDYIKSNNFYKVNFSLRSLTEYDINQLEKQVVEDYTCIFRNIGTEDKAIIKSEAFNSLSLLNSVYNKLTERYKHMYYNNRYNSFMFDNNVENTYDSFLTEFINRHRLFNEKYDYNTLVLNNEDYYPNFDMDFDLCIYSIIERCDMSELPNEIIYTKKPITYQDSIFTRYRDCRVKSVFLVPMVNNYEYIPCSLIEKIKNNFKDTNDSVVDVLLIDFFNKKIKDVSGLHLKELDKLHKYFGHDFKTYISIPIILYIMRKYYQETMKTNT